MQNISSVVVALSLACHRLSIDADGAINTLAKTAIAWRGLCRPNEVEVELVVVSKNFPRTMLLALSVLIIGTNCSHAQTEISKQAIAKAEAAIAKVRKACAADINNFCSKVTPGEGRLALCMLAHEDQVSDGCFSTVFDVADNIDLALSNISRAADVCGKEIDKHCAAVEPGEGRIAQCLIDKESQLASACRAEVAGVKARFAK